MRVVLNLGYFDIFCTLAVVKKKKLKNDIISYQFLIYDKLGTYNLINKYRDKMKIHELNLNKI